MFYIGTSGYTYDFWGPSKKYPNEISNFYPRNMPTSKWLEHYSSHLNSVEINCTRYRSLKPEMCARWVKQVPDHFGFTIKVGLYFTHAKKLNDPEEWWDEMAPCIEALGTKFTSLLFQFHPSFRCTPQNIAKLYRVQEIVPPHIDCAIEFRDMSWYTDDQTKKLFTRRNWCLVELHVPEVRGQNENFGDLPGGFHGISNNDRFRYLRFHGTRGYSCGTYDYPLLSPIVDQVRSSSVEKVCIYFNNTDTWEFLPESYRGKHHLFHGTFSFILRKSHIIPSALFDALCVKQRLIEKSCAYDEEGFRVLQVNH